VFSGSIEGLEPGGTPTLRCAGQPTQAVAVGQDGPFAAALRHLSSVFQTQATQSRLRAVAHRIVHGGDRYTGSVRVDADVLAHLQQYEPLAPLHQPHNLAGVRALQQAFPGLPQVACFDTAFHAGMPAVERRFALPPHPDLQGVRRYGFHGLSYQYLATRLAQRSPAAAGRCVLAHLGNGASVCATIGGRSVATSMGFSALDGLMMGTRSGSIDAGVLLHLLQHGWNAQQLEDLLYRQSGLKGVSGLSADMRVLRDSSSAAAHDAVELFTYRVLRECGAMTALLGGIDLLAFTGGIGENDPVLRQRVCEGLAYLGVTLDTEANRGAGTTTIRPIHAPGSRVEVWVVPTDEGRVAAEQAWALIS
jgi:acetate kinase